MDQPGVRLDRQRVLHQDAARRGYPAQVVAPQVDQHDVLGDLRRGGRQRPAALRQHLRERLPVDIAAERLSTFFEAAVHLMSVMARAAGHRHLGDFTIDDLTTFKKDMADLTGDIVATYSWPNTVIDNVTSEGSDDIYYVAYTPRIPKVGTRVTFVVAKGELGSPCDPVRTMSSNDLQFAMPAPGGREDQREG